MKEGDVVLTALRQADGTMKNRPAILIAKMPPFGDWLVCGISTQLRQQVEGFDEIIRPSDSIINFHGWRHARRSCRMRNWEG